MFIDTPASKISAAFIGLFWIISTIILIIRKVYVAAAVFFMFYIPIGLLYVHDINCIFTGACNVWGWFKTAVLILSFALSLIFMVVLGEYGDFGSASRITNIIQQPTQTASAAPKPDAGAAAAAAAAQQKTTAPSAA